MQPRFLHVNLYFFRFAVYLGMRPNRRRKYSQRAWRFYSYTQGDV